MSDRFCGVGAWLARSNSAVFLRGSEDAVVFPEGGGDGYFDHNGGATGLMIRRGPRSRVAVKLRRSEAIWDDVGLK